jgi:hypothetical protein
MSKLTGLPTDRIEFEGGWGFLNTVNTSRSVERVYSNMPVRDKDWVGICQAGHRTTWETLRSVTLGHYWCDDCEDEHDETETRCAECDAVLRGGTKPPDPAGFLVPGMLEMRLTAHGTGDGPKPGEAVRFAHLHATGSAIVTGIWHERERWKADLIATGPIEMRRG